MFTQPGFLGASASFGSDLILLLEIGLFVALCIGVAAQRRGMYRAHDRIQTPVVLLNAALVAYAMIPSFTGNRVAQTLPQRPFDPYYLVVAIHAGLGLIAAALSIYCLLAGHKILPRRIGRLRYWMWAAFAFWTAAVAAGVTTYVVWYGDTAVPVTAAADETAVAGKTAVAPQNHTVLLQNFQFAPVEITVVAGSAITFINQDGAPHNVTLSAGSAGSDNFFQDETFTLTFDEVGVFPIYCSLHGDPDGSGMAAVVTVVEASAANVAAVAAAPTPDLTPPTPTPAPTVAPPPVDPVAQAAPQQTTVGLLSFFDSAAPGDSLTLQLSGVAAPAGFELRLWLQSGAAPPIDLGPLTPDENGRLTHQHTDPDGVNLLGAVDTVLITAEPQFDDDPTPGQALYRGAQPAQATAAIRALTVQASDAPAGLGYAIAARRQAEELLRHVEFVRTAHALLSIADAQRHAEHVVNILAGEQGAAFGDLDGAHGVQNPGDGFGILPYIAAIAETAAAAANAPDSNSAIQLHAAHVEMAAANARTWAEAAQQAAQHILAAGSVGDIGPQVETLATFSALLLNGQDANGDGEIAPSEGGLFTAYQHAQYMAAIGIHVSE